MKLDAAYIVSFSVTVALTAYDPALGTTNDMLPSVTVCSTSLIQTVRLYPLVLTVMFTVSPTLTSSGAVIMISGVNLPTTLNSTAALSFP